MESTALRLITSLGSAEVQPQLSRLFSEPKSITLLSGESEELNRVMVLTLARALHVTGKMGVFHPFFHRFSGKNSFGIGMKTVWDVPAVMIIRDHHFLV